MDTAYGREEIISSSKAAKNLGRLLDEVRRRGRFVVSRNNRLEAVLVSIENYEEIVEDLEHLLIALEIRERRSRDTGKRVPWEVLKARHGL